MCVIWRQSFTWIFLARHVHERNDGLFFTHNSKFEKHIHYWRRRDSPKYVQQWKRWHNWNRRRVQENKKIVRIILILEIRSVTWKCHGSDKSMEKWNFVHVVCMFRRGRSSIGWIHEVIIKDWANVSRNLNVESFFMNILKKIPKWRDFELQYTFDVGSFVYINLWPLKHVCIKDN